MLTIIMDVDLKLVHHIHHPIFLFLSFLSFLTFINPSYALVSIDNLLLGENIDEAESTAIDPLRYVYSPSLENSAQEKKNQSLLQYQGFFAEGENLKNYCEKNLKLNYFSDEEKNTVLKSMAATLQYIGLDITTRSIALYSQKLEFSAEEFNYLVRRLIGNYCSENTTVISLRQLAKNLLLHFKDPQEGFQLPSYASLNHFPKNFSSLDENKQSLQQEFFQTIKLFRAFCSWGNEAENWRLMVPLLNNPYLMSFIIRQMNSKKIDWLVEKKQFALVEDQQTIKVLCQEDLCRKTDGRTLEQRLPRSLGSISLADDLKSAYCQHLRTSDYLLNSEVQSAQIRTWILQQAREDDLYLINQMIALLTGVPDLMIRSQKFEDLPDLMRKSVDYYWQKWADRTTENFSRDLFYEESITVERSPLSEEHLLSHQLLHTKESERGKKEVFPFALSFQVNLGEMDRLYQQHGKLKVHFNLEVPVTLLRWMWQEWRHRDPLWVERNEKMMEIFQVHFKDQVAKFQKRFIIPPWKNNLQQLIVLELLEQLENYSGGLFEQLPDDKQQKVVIPIYFHYGPFALKYFHYRFRAQHGHQEVEF